MTLEELKNKIQDLGTEIRDDARALAKASAGREVSMDDVRKMQSAMKDKQERLTALQDAFTVQSDEESKKVPKADPAQANALTEMRKSNEYARSFALGIRKGIRPGGAYDENCKVLYDALTIGGGDPAGEDGGFLVPEDIDHQIKELVRTLNPLEEFFSTENVTGTSGWRVQDAAPTTGMAAIDEMGAVLEGEAPTFTKVPYTVSKYGMFLPVSKELASDEIANLFGYLSRWFARKETITKNTLLLAALGTLSTTLITAGEELTVQIVREGKEPGQGVAYLDDGTMIVVDNGRRYVGESVATVVTTVLQTSAGRMIFTRLKTPEDSTHA